MYPDGCKTEEQCPLVKTDKDTYGDGFRSFRCRCKQQPIICRPTSEWVVIDSYDNSNSISPGQLKYQKVRFIRYIFYRLRIIGKFFQKIKHLLIIFIS